MSLSILIVEPDVLMLEATSDLLTAAGYRTICVPTTAHAAGALQAIKIHAAIFSATHEDPCGSHFAEAAKGIQPLLKIILADTGALMRHIPVGMEAVIAKPLLPQEVDSAIRDLFPDRRGPR